MKAALLNVKGVMLSEIGKKNQAKLQFEDALSYSATMNAAARETKDSKKGIEAILLNEKVKWRS